METTPPPIVLIVEDDAIQREHLSTLLRDADMDVIEFQTAEAGELILAKVGPELSVLVTDVNLGHGRTGIELAKFARSQFPQLKIVIVSGKEQPIPANVNFLHKPYLAADLMREIDHSPRS